MPSPETVAVPTVVPPLEQLDGGLGCGPNTSKVIVFDAENPPDSTAVAELALIAVPVIPEDGPLPDTAGAAGRYR
ncbi:MAG: hypothetical protein ACRDLM_08750 [Gaiellaceae bacterium]